MAWSGAAQTTGQRGRVVILGFDGVAPAIIDEMLECGELPNLSALRKQGQYERLRSTIPPQSPTAWSTFATCTNPGAHGVFDFLRRDPKTYLPGVGFGQAHHAQLATDGSVAKPARFETVRTGTPFWSTADAHGARCKILSMPFCFPPDPLKHGRMFSSLGVPDIRGTTSMFFWMSDAFSSSDLQQSLSGGMRLPLTFSGSKATVKVPGARDITKTRAAYMEVPIDIIVDRKAHRVTLDVQGQHAELGVHQWSDWFVWTFPVSAQFTVQAISRFYVLEAAEHVHVYMNCLQFHPDEPYITFTTPKEYSRELRERYGLYKTIGWVFDTHALRQDALTEDAFLEDVEQTMSWRQRLTLDEMAQADWDLLVSVFTATDRVAHLFWHYRDPGHPLYDEEKARAYGRALENAYVKMDTIVGEVMHRLAEKDLLLVISDHGFNSFRRGFNVNTWLIREGYLAVTGQSDPQSAFNEEAYLRGYDWKRTRAYALGLGSIYLNLTGREGQGIVSPEDAEPLMEELRGKLKGVKDPQTQEFAIKDIYTRNVYKGASMTHAPDLELGYTFNYQSTKSTVKGAAPREVFEPNMDKWSGDHVASDVEISSGILFANQKLAPDPAIIDLGSTVLDYLGIPIPDWHEGKSLV
ncbi:MAG: alkaline phosphatase family protein [Candidatus Hydrogenedentes bacterium]|nr:alkaline phosphatase family protein [Candidatus Hydrogenedentota bacterium]